ncbi:S8 family serine peptidase [Candidatus Poribacteria bacterium]|nr:S8 family serine peptidase [Candidatus Poribacteria bacterium]
MALKFLNASGSGTIADALECMEYATLKGANLTSNSWGLNLPSGPIVGAIAIANGPPLFVAAAGNDGNDTDVNPHFPSSYKLPKVISVAATDHNDKKASFSNFGLQSVDLGAPGVNILSTVPAFVNPSGYAAFSGTSMATPHVAGVAALIMAENPTLTGLQVKQKILTSVDPVADLVGKTVTGGRLNAANALAITAVALAPSRETINIDPLQALPEVNPVDPNRVTVHALLPAFPNPSNPEVWMPYQLSDAADVTISIYTSTGQVVRTLNLGHRPGGSYNTRAFAAHWDGRDTSGQPVASGVYFYTLRAGDFTATRKFILAR